MIGASRRSTYISGQQTIDSECPSLALIIRSEHNRYILDTNHQRQSPDDQREGAEKVIIAGFGAESRRVDVEGGGANVAIDDANGLVGEPGGMSMCVDLVTMYNPIGVSLCEKRETGGSDGSAYQKRYLPLKV